jgi:hypothetical protein
MSCKNTAPSAESLRAAHNSNGRYATHQATNGIIESEAIPRLEVLASNAAAGLMGRMTAEDALISSIRLGDSVRRWIEVESADRHLAVAR